MMKPLYRLMLQSLLSLICASAALDSAALRIDDTHYRFCVMDDATITDYAAVSAENSGTLPTLPTVEWNSYKGVLINGKVTTQSCQNYITDMPVLMTQTYSGSDPSLVHRWLTGYNGVAYQQTSYFYITVDAPAGLRLKNVPSKMLTEEEAQIEKVFTSSYTQFSGGGYFSYEYQSSNPEVVAVKSGKITAKSIGKATITVKAYAKNRKYDGSYYIGSATAEIEVVDNLNPTDISLDRKELYLNTGEKATLSASLVPEDARTVITWSTSDAAVATVENGTINAVGRGNAVIEAKTSNGLSAKCYVTVLGYGDYQRVPFDGLYYDLDRTDHTATVVPATKNNGSVEIGYISGEVTIPEKVSLYGTDYTVTSIGTNAFLSCNISSVSLPQSISSIGRNAFKATAIRDITIPDGLMKIGEEAFCGSDIESFLIGPNVSAIGYGAFCNCKNLRAIYISDDNRHFTIHNECLYSATMKELYYVPLYQQHLICHEKLETIKSEACALNQNLLDVSFNSNLVSIENGAFCDCHNITKLSFPNSLQEIGKHTFLFCTGLKEVYFGNKIKIIGEEAFCDTDNLTKIKIDALNPPTANENTFANYDATLIVPKGRISVYQKNTEWGKFGDIVDDETNSGIDDVLSDLKEFGTHGDIYSIDGALIKRHATEADVKALSPGIYIVGGQKIHVE